MNDQNQTSASDPSAPIHQGWREQRRAECAARHEAHWLIHRRRNFGWFAGPTLILIGVIFLLQNLGISFIGNFWALFILIPAFWAYVTAWETYQDQGKLMRRGTGALTVGILFTILSLGFLLNLDVGGFWPVLLIVVGLVLLGTAWLPEQK